MNVKLLEKIKKWLLAEPKRFYMPDVVRRRIKGEELSVNDGSRPYPRCGTAGCFAGWACLLSEKEVSAEMAQGLLGLNSRQADRLFYKAPRGFSAIWSGDGEKKTAKLAAKRIELFIKTKGRR